MGDGEEIPPAPAVREDSSHLPGELLAEPGGVVLTEPWGTEQRQVDRLGTDIGHRDLPFPPYSSHPDPAARRRELGGVMLPPDEPDGGLTSSLRAPRAMEVGGLRGDEGGEWFVDEKPPRCRDGGPVLEGDEHAAYTYIQMSTNHRDWPGLR
ncbi:MAG: hypothetical protein DCC50_09450 [Acidobacteria bacterium]|nr:MAG: hypothetical protein DCC50_09450 [Acidobacteriota bacterium]